MSTTFSAQPGRAALKARKDDLYETPAIAVQTLLRVEPLPHRIWEPACGKGAIVEVLRAAGKQVIATDLVDYGYEDAQAGVDFLMELKAPEGVTHLVTNPPFKLADAFVRQSIRLVDTTIMLLRLAYLEGDRRSDLIDVHLHRVWVGKERLPMMHRDGWEGPKVKGGGIPFAWFVFKREPRFGPIALQRMSWRES